MVGTPNGEEKVIKAIIVPDGVRTAESTDTRTINPVYKGGRIPFIFSIFVKLEIQKNIQIFQTDRVINIPVNIRVDSNSPTGTNPNGTDKGSKRKQDAFRNDGSIDLVIGLVSNGFRGT